MKKYNYSIRDSRRNLDINVKREDIKGAICSDHERCVIAKAIKRQTKAKWVDVGAHVCLVGRAGNKAERFILSSKAKEQIRFFDMEGSFAPCKVSLISPENVNQGLGQRIGRKARSGKHKNPRRIVNAPSR